MASKALAAIDRVGITTTLVENPELAAMAAICAILRDLSDEERLRVMRWSFGRFSPEFKRPVADHISSPETSAPVPVPMASVPVPEPAVSLPDQTAADFERQISELGDLFPTRATPRRTLDPRKILEFV